MKRVYKYEVGEEVNGLIIIEQTLHGKKNYKAYVVESVNYPDAPHYVAREDHLRNGKGCAYTSGSRIYEGNSVYSVGSVKDYIIDVELSKTLSKSSSTLIRAKCPTCNGEEKMVTPKQLTTRGFKCDNCYVVKSTHIYEVGDIVNGVEILEQTRNNNQQFKDYMVRSVEYPNTEPYSFRESSLKSGIRDKFSEGREVVEDNSIYSKEDIRKYIVNVEESKTIFYNSNHKVKVKCPKCETVQNETARNLWKFGIDCYKCKSKDSHSYKHEVGEEVNGLVIIEQTVNKYGRKSYKAQSIEHETAPHIFVNESSLTAGQGCPYTSGNKVYEKTSIYSIERLREYIVNVEESKTIGKNSKKKIEVRCPSCNDIEDVTVRRFVKGNVYCSKCSSNTSYPELFFSAYLEVKGVEYEYQYQLDDSLRRFDFYIPSKNIVVETHGEQHYKENSAWYDRSNESDAEKRIYCKENNITLIELDCSKSNFKFIQNQINNDKFLDDITKSEEKEMLKIIEKNKRHPVEDIINFYETGLSVKEVSDKLSVSEHIVYKVLKTNNVKYRPPGKRVRCLNTGEVFDSIEKAAKWCGLVKGGSITLYCDDSENRKWAGKHPNTGDRLRWEWTK